MKRDFLMLGIGFLLSMSVAATYTIVITTNTAQENRLTRARTILNTQGFSFATNDAMVQFVCPNAVTNQVSDTIRRDLAGSIATKAQNSNATPTQLDTACTDLGGTIVNGLCQ